MSDFQREIRFCAGYDYRDDPKDQRGAHGAELHFILRGPLGAISAVVSTGWMLRPLTGRYMRHDGPQDRRDKPGVDGRLNDCFPRGAYILSHALVQRQDWWSGPSDCDILGGKCYGDIGYTVSDTFLDRLLRDGEEGAFAFLAELHDAWLSGDPKETT